MPHAARPGFRALSLLQALLLLSTLSLSVAISGVQGCASDDAEVQNLEAFAKLFGYVRYFHPSDEAAGLDWEAFAALGATRVKDAATPGELKAELEALFLPVAPTLRIFEADAPPPEPPPELSPPDAAELETVAWQHLGVGLGGANSIYRSARLHRETVLANGQGNAVVIQCLDAGTMAGKEVRFTARGKAMETGARVQIWARVDLDGGGMGFFDNMMDRPVTSTEWTELAIRGPVDEAAARICFGGIFLGGETGLDDLGMEVREGEGPWEPVEIVNGGFEEWEDGSLWGWSAPSPGFSYGAGESDAPEGDRFLRVTQEVTVIAGPLFEGAPEVGEVVEKPLGRGIMARIPLALYSRDHHTLGTPDPADAASLAGSLAGVEVEGMTAEDEALRVADVILAWNVFQHFYPYFDVVEVDWDGVLTASLSRALSDESPEDFLSTLRWLVSRLQDGHGSVAGPVPQQSGVPVAFDRVEEEVVVVASAAPDRVQVGDVVESIDGVPAVERLEALAETFSGSPQWRRWRALNQLGAGPSQSEAVLDLRRGEESVRATLVRETPQGPEESRPQDIEEVEPGIFYVNLDRVEIGDFQERAEELAAADGVVFDLRGYPNGNHLALTYLTGQPLNSAFWRVPQIIYPDHDGEPRYRESRWDLPPSRPRFQGKIVFLTDGRAISYAESVMGIVEHYRLGEIVGGATAGANGNVNPFVLPGGFRISWTGMQVVKHDGSQHHLVGIQPTIPTARTLAGVREGRDELLERAVEVIRGG